MTVTDAPRMRYAPKVRGAHRRAGSAHDGTAAQMRPAEPRLQQRSGMAWFGILNSRLL